MLVIFGFGHKTNKEVDLRELSNCDHCHNTSRWKLNKQMTWLTLFFIPVVPIKTEYLKICPICRQGKPLHRDQYINLINKAV